MLPVVLDLLGELRSGFEALEPVRESRERVPWEHGRLPVVSRAGLARMKRLRDSGRDRDDIALLEADARGEGHGG